MAKLGRLILIATPLTGTVSLIALCSMLDSCGEARLYPLRRVIPQSKVTCSVTRDECVAYTFLPNGNFGCTSANKVKTTSSPVTTCFVSSTQTPQQACDKYCTDYYELAPGNFDSCETTVIDSSTAPAAPGDCDPTFGTASNGKTAFAECVRGGRECLASATQSGTTICTQVSGQMNELASGCFDPTKTDADAFCRNGLASPALGTLHEAWVDVIGVDLNSLHCGAQPTTTALLSYGVAAGSLGNATFSGTTVPLNATGGFVKLQGFCDGPGDVCLASALADMRVTFADTAIQGVALQNLEARLAAPAPIVTSNGRATIAKSSFQLELSGTVSGGISRMVFPASADVPLTFNARSLTFPIHVDVTAGTSGPVVVPVSVSANVSANSANPGAACAGFSTIQNLFGFEDVGDWTSSQATLSLSPSLHTQGCYGINVVGSGYMVANSAAFATPLSGIRSTIGLDVFVPTGQPNPYWLGAVQLYASCPSAGMNNAYLGQAELTGKPTGAFSTLAFTVSSGVANTLSQPHDDCFFSVAVNANATPSPVVLDNLRFIP